MKFWIIAAGALLAAPTAALAQNHERPEPQVKAQPAPSGHETQDSHVFKGAGSVIVVTVPGKDAPITSTKQGNTETVTFEEPQTPHPDDTKVEYHEHPSSAGSGDHTPAGAQKP